MSAQHRTTAPLDSDHVVQAEGGAAISYDDVLSDLINSPAVVVHSCTVQNQSASCLFVKKFLNAGCTTQTLDYGSTEAPCVRADTKSDARFCMVTDEFSQVGLALSMGGSVDAKAAFLAWANTVRTILASEPRLPLWRVGVDLSGTVAAIDFRPAGGDDASDATARIVTALFIAASRSSVFNLQERRDLRFLADEISRAFLRDFVRTPFTGVVAGTPNVAVQYWLASGWKTGARATAFENNGTFTFGGYFGDVVAALAAAFAGGIGRQAEYQQYAADTVSNYFLASAFDGANFRVPPKAFLWQSDGTSICTECPVECDGQPSWDDADAPRAISLCRARYQAMLAGMSLPASVDAYCDAWLARGFDRAAAPYGYAVRYALNGARCPFGRDFKAAGLGATMFFRYGAADDFEKYIEQAFSYYQRGVTPVRFKDTNCLDGYFPLFPIVNYGMGLGRDRGAYGSPESSLLAVVAEGNWNPLQVLVQWTPRSGAATYQVQRRYSQSPAWQNVGAPTTKTSYTDHEVLARTVYAYRVVALDGAGATLEVSHADFATTFEFTPRLDPGSTLISAQHFSDVGQMVNSARRAAGLSSDVPLTATELQPVHASDLTSLRSGLDEARSALGIAPLTYLQPHVASGVAITTWEIRELRDGVR